jgi:hypothetical protein
MLAKEKPAPARASAGLINIEYQSHFLFEKI